MPRLYRNLEERLLANSQPENGCWIWLGKRGGGRNGEYGHINLRVDGQHKTLKAHRVAYIVFKGPIPAGMTVDHTCSNPLCINPDHLALETNQRNTQLRDERRAAA
jgi:hypothetical protein